MQDGLPQDSVLHVGRTADGYLWLGTLSGLARFNGHEFIHFHNDNTRALRSEAIQSMLPDPQGNLWLGTGRGLVRGRRGELKLYLWAGGGETGAQSLWRDPDGTLWVATAGRGLLNFSKGIYRPVLADGKVIATTAIRRTRDGRLWLGLPDGIGWLEDNRLRRLPLDDALKGAAISSLWEDRAGALWAASNRGLIRIVEGQATRLSTRDGLPADALNAVIEDRDGNLWIGSDAGLVRKNVAGLSVYTARDGLPSDRVRALHEDAEGSLWVGTESGLLRLTDRSLVPHFDDNGLARPSVTALWEDPDKAVWLATADRGLLRVSAGKTITSYTAAEGLPSDEVTTLTPGAPGELWVGTRKGLARVRVGESAARPSDPRLGGWISALTMDRAGALWVGFENGDLVRLLGAEAIRYSQQDGLPGKPIRAILEHSAGTLWIATRGGGLVRRRDDRFVSLRRRDAMPEYLATLHEDEAGSVWIGTDGAGLIRLRERTPGAVSFSIIGTGQGLPSDKIKQIVPDGAGSLWLCSLKGVIRVSLQVLNAAADRQTGLLPHMSFERTPGGGGVVCNNGDRHAALRLRSGRLLFTTREGLLAVDPARARPNDVPPQVGIESVLVDRRPVSAKDDVIIPPGSRAIEIQFAGLSLVEPHRVLYRHQLEGMDPDWSPPSPTRTAHYGNLPPGSYTLRVMASNNDGLWSATVTRLGVVVRPRFHQTTWFYLLCGTLVVSLTAGLHRLRLAHVRSRYDAVIAERNRVARDLHDTLLQGITAVSLQLESAAGKLRAQPDAAARQLAVAQSMMKQSLDEARNFVSDLRGRSSQAGNLGLAIRTAVERLSTALAVPVEVTETGEPRSVPNLQANHLFYIAREGVMNAMKHAAARRVLVELHHEPAQLRLIITDDGRGFDTARELPPEEPGESHFGLRGIRERADQIGARLTVASIPDQGTRIEVIMPVPAPEPRVR